MIDPNILLQSKPVNIETPLEAQGQVQQVQNLKNLGQIQQGTIAMQPGELQAQGLENQQRQINLAAEKHLDTAMQMAYSTAPDGSLQFDQNKVAGYLAQNGAGHLVPGVVKTFTELNKSAAEAKKTALEAQTAQLDYFGDVGASIRSYGYDPEFAIAHIGQAVASGAIERQQGIGLVAQIKQLQAQAQGNPDALLAGMKGLVDPVIKASPKQRALEAQETTAGARAKSAENSGQRADDERSFQDQSLLLRKGELDRQGATQAEQLRHNLVTEDQGQQRIDKPGAASSTMQRFYTTEADKAETEEKTHDRMATALGNALHQGDMYVTPAGVSVSFDKQIPRLKDETDAEYQARAKPLIEGFTREMNLRVKLEQKLANGATLRKNSYTRLNGGIPKVSDEQAIAARGGQRPDASQVAIQAPPQQPAVAQEGQIFRNATTGERRQFKNGQWSVISPARQ